MTVAELKYALATMPNDDEVVIRIGSVIEKPALVYRQELLFKSVPRIATVIR